MRANIFKSVLIFSFCCFLGTVIAQTPYQPVAYNNPTLNYVRLWEATAPETNPNTLTGRPLKDVKQTTQFFDGLGRPLQTVVKQGSLETSTNTNVDVVSPVVYDDYGREQYKFLPFASTATDATKSDGNFKLNPFQQQQSFYSTQLSGQNETFYYGKTNFEASPLNRVHEAYAAGNSWVGSESNTDPTLRKRVQLKYWLNTDNDDVKIWNVSNSGSYDVFGFYSLVTSSQNTSGKYGAGQLYKTVTIDEHGKQVIEFKDKEGKVILKKVQLTASAETDPSLGSNHDNWLCTYYIYDDLNNLRCVVQPEGVKWLANNNWNFTATGGDIILKEQCFRFEYDARNRMIMKKVPGMAGAVYMVYDARDRLVMTQEPNLRVNNISKWTIIKYDELNRPKETGIWQSPSTNDFLTHINSASTNYTEYPSTTSNYEALSFSHFNDYTNIPGGLSGYYLTTWDGYFAATSPNSPYPVKPQASSATKGMVTWTQTKILNSSPEKWIYTCTFYDDKGRAIQVQSKNSLTGVTDVVTTQYSWSGQPLLTVAWQQVTGTNPQENLVLSKFTYDDLGRVIKTEKKIGNSILNTIATIASASWVTTSSAEYNLLGQVKTKKIGHKKDGNGNYPTTVSAIETQNFDYNIRGWMLGMNRGYTKDANNDNYFGFDLGYDKQNNGLIGDKTYKKAQFNGNIAGMVWKSKGDGEKRKYDFDYDPVNRLLKAEFSQYTGGDFNQSAGINYNVLMGDGSTANSAYDYNGNIKSMTQYGWKIGASPSNPIDLLIYTYAPNSNKLQGVTDAANDKDSKLGDFKYDATTKTGTDYSYDDNGNLVLDNNKKISSITYNHLNLPSVITITNKGTITYTYDAAGVKLRKTTVENNVPVYYGGATNNNTITTTTDYAGAFVFESKSYSVASGLNYTMKLQFGGQEEGRIRALYANDALPNTITGLVYDYMLKDHLGNVRMVLTDEQQLNIYPIASVEDATVNCEKAFYSINTSKTVSRSTIYDPNNQLGYQNNNVINAGPCGTGNTTNAKMYKLFASGNVADTGLSMTLKVMSGDVINIWAKSYYNDKNTSGVNYSLPVMQLLTGFLGAGAGGANASSHGGTVDILKNNSGTAGGLGSFINDPSRGSGELPKAYINWVLFDEQFNFVTGGYSRTDQDPNTIKDHRFTDLVMQKSGYLYIYVSNESPVAVFFDNLQVTHNRSAILEENHYYPFGLTMAGLSSKSLGLIANKYNFNAGSELNIDFDINLYETRFRGLDPQIGRFLQVDPLSMASISVSPYQYCNNNPILFNDPFGLDTVRINGEGSHTIKIRKGDVLAWSVGETTSYYNYDPSDPNAVNGFVGAGINQGSLSEITITGKSRDNTSAWGLGWEWMTGTGPRVHHFKDGDPFTKQLQKHEHIQNTRDQISNGLANCKIGTGKVYTNNYELGGFAGVPKYIRDYSTLLTFGATGNIAVTYLGSYGLKYEILSIDEECGTAQVHFYIANSSTIESATHPPVIGYTEWWSSNIGKPLNSYFSSGPLSKTTQTVEWTETIKFK